MHSVTTRTATDEAERFAGDIYVFFAAALYAIYEVLYSLFGLSAQGTEEDREDYDAVLEEEHSPNKVYDSMTTTTTSTEYDPESAVTHEAALAKADDDGSYNQDYSAEVAHLSPLIAKTKSKRGWPVKAVDGAEANGDSEGRLTRHAARESKGHESVLEPFDVFMIIGMLGMITLLALWVTIALVAAVSASCNTGGGLGGGAGSSPSDPDLACGSGFFGIAAEPFQLPSPEQCVFSVVHSI